MTFTKSIRNLTKVQYPGQTRDLKTGLGYSIKPESPQIAQIINQANLEDLFPDKEVKIGGRQHKTNQPKKKQTSSFVISRVSEQLSEADIQSELEEINNIKVAKLFQIQSRSLDKPTQLIRGFTDDDLACPDSRIRFFEKDSEISKLKTWVNLLKVVDCFIDSYGWIKFWAYQKFSYYLKICIEMLCQK